MFRLLEKTYNTSILNDMSPQEQKEYVKNISPQSTLGKLLHNHYYMDTPQPRYIAGPKTLTLHKSEEYSMTVYTFGETQLQIPIPWHGYLRTSLKKICTIVPKNLIML